ncbi:MAG: response regulator transcription factor [Desulfobulbales bacterium]|nr:response regulator transcription factor [Desulfobulbales bacterium]
MQSILVVEDHTDQRKWWLENLGEVFPETEVVAVSSLSEARECLRGRPFTMAILDINLPDGSGIDLLREISMNSPDTYGVICSIYDDDKHIFSALRAGAKGYLIKDQPRQQQLKQLKEIVSGQPPLSPGVVRRILEYFSRGERQHLKDDSGAARLTDREKEILTLLAKGYSRPEAANILGLTLNTVSGYTKTIYQKLNISNRAEAVIEALKLGLIDQDMP